MDLNNLYFGQYTLKKRKILGDDLKLKDMPHYKFLIGKEQEYIDYLKLTHNQEKIEKIINKFKNLLESIKKEGIKNPITITGIDRKIIIDGNHRSSICLFLGIKPKIKEIPVNKYLNKTIKNKIRYGTNEKNIPYQSIYYKGKELIKGRRDDLIKRINHIDVKGKEVVDIGCNYGTSCFLALERGAKKVIGYDIDYNLIKSATKINNLFGYKAEFEVKDFSKIQEVKGDVAFCFSVDKHIKNNKNLLRNLKNFKEVYFETHQHSPIPENIKKASEQQFLIKLGSRKLYRLKWI